MAFKYSQKSINNLSSCHPDLQAVFLELIKYYDCTIIEGHRSEDRQNHLKEIGFSKLYWPDSKHNIKPSLAVDAAPYINGIGIPWNDHKTFCYFAGIVMGVAYNKGISIRWGGDFNRDRIAGNQAFFDAAHFELDL